MSRNSGKCFLHREVECESVFAACGESWNREMRDLQRRDLDVLLTKVQREAYVSKARRAKRKARSLEKKTPETLESITTPEADARLSKLVEGNPRFIGYSAAELAKIITRNARKNCSATTVKNTRCWKEIMEERRRQKGDSRSLAAVNLSHTLAAATPDKRQGTPLEELARTEEQQSAIRQVEQSAMNSEVKEDDGRATAGRRFASRGPP